MLISLGFFSFQAHAVFVPESDSGAIEPESTNVAIQEPAAFTDLARSIEKIYSPIVAQLGGKLAIHAQWDSQVPNAYARKTFSNWSIFVTGGLAKQPAMTKDGLALVICHEMGHHVGGFPFAQTGLAAIFGMDWVANEGEADYYATQVCARKIWANEPKQNEVFRSSASAFAKSECDKVWKTESEQNICYRTVTASEALANVMANLSKKPVPQLHTPNTSSVTATYEGHPEAQCRLDTYFQGAICPVRWNDKYVPGKKASGGKKGLLAEQQAASVSCSHAGGFTYGLRPTCWFKPRL